VLTDLFRLPAAGVETRWASPENPGGARGAGGRANGGRKGRAWLTLAAGETVTLAESVGAPGTVRRIWATLDDRSPAMLRGLRLDCSWDGADTPAVSVPFGDFFGVGRGRTAAFHSALFSNPEGRSFVCEVPMPFRTGMRLQVTNESGRDLAYLFYDVAYTLGDEHGPDVGYLHAHWRRENPTTLQQDYELLPLVSGRGRFLGVNVGVRADVARYGSTWWGEGEAKFYLDGDTEHPTLCGTGTEDYIGTAWGQGAFAHPYQGCPVADGEKSEYCFYRWHVPDPVYFSRSLRVAMQQIGHAFGDRLRDLLASGQTIYSAGGPGLVPAPPFGEIPPSGLLFERADDWSSCAYLYLDRPGAALPPLAPAEERMAGL
jgi:hypothetical protein